MQRLKIGAVWAVLVALNLFAAGEPPAVGLPGDDVPSGWQRRGETLRFVGAELYRHVNGGAELYQRFGFERLTVQDYAGGPRQARLEVFWMSDEAAAAGLFAELAAGLPAAAGFGQAATRDDYQIQFRRGRCCVTVTGYEPGAETAAALAALAAASDAALRDAAG